MMSRCRPTTPRRVCRLWSLHSSAGPWLKRRTPAARRSLEKLNFTKLWKLHDVAVQANDPEACNYIEDMLEEQAADVKTAAEYVSQLRRVDKGLGVYVFDKTFQEEEGGLA